MSLLYLKYDKKYVREVETGIQCSVFKQHEYCEMWFSLTLTAQLLMKNRRLIIQRLPAGRCCHDSLFRCLSLSRMANNPSFHHQNCFPRCFFCYFFASASYFWVGRTVLPLFSSLQLETALAGLCSLQLNLFFFFLYPLSQTHLFTLTWRTHIKTALVQVASSGSSLCWRQRGSFLTFRFVEGKPLTITALTMGQLTSYWHWKK